MKLARLSAVLFAVSIWASAVFAQLPQLGEMSNAETESAARKQSDDKPKPKITLRVYDFAHLNPAVLAGSKEVTTEILRKAGVESVWLDCGVSEASCGSQAQHPEFRLRILPSALAKDMVSDDSLGFAVPCAQNEEACLFYIFYSRVSALAAAHGFGPERPLGHVMAHEIGHTLLGPNAHGLYGVMQARLSLIDMERTLYFTTFQSKRLRIELLARNHAPNR
jgi:hypothetical protein